MNLLLAFILIFIASIIGAFGSLLLKMGSSKFQLSFRSGLIKAILTILKNWKLILGLFLYVVSTVFFIIVIKTTDLSIAYPMTSMTYIMVIALSMIFLKEKLNTYKFAGIVAIILGVILVTL